MSLKRVRSQAGQGVVGGLQTVENVIKGPRQERVSLEYWRSQERANVLERIGKSLYLRVSEERHSCESSFHTFTWGILCLTYGT